MNELARVDRSTMWVAIASVIAGSLDAATTILLLQIGVTTAELGTATLAIALFPILDRLGGVGLSAATVCEPEPDDRTLSTMFWLGIGATVVLVSLLALLRPLLVKAFPDPIVSTLLVAYSARLLIRHFSYGAEAMLKRALRHGELSLIWSTGALAELVTKIGFAWAGVHGDRELAIWCFVLGPIANVTVSTIGVLSRYPWRPRLQFRRDVASRALRFLVHVSGGELLFFAYSSADYLVIGAWFGPAAVGVYRLAYELVLDVVRLLSLVTTEVALPAFARVATDPAALARYLVRFTRQNAIVIAPFLSFVAIEADDLLDLLFNIRDEDAATAARVLCGIGALRTLSFILTPLLAARGRARRVLAYHGITAVVLPTTFALVAMLAPGQGYIGIAWAWSLAYPVAFAALVAMALPESLEPKAYFQPLMRITACAGVAALVGWSARTALGGVTAPSRLAIVAAVVAGLYVLLLWRVEGVTPKSITRSLRSR